MPADLLLTTFPPAAGALSSVLSSTLSAAFLAAVLAPLPVRAQAQRTDVCALVACSASGQRAAALTEPARARPGALGTATPSHTTAPASATTDRPAPTTAPRDPWVRRFQGRETEGEDACLLNFGLDGQLARKGTLDTHVLGRTQAWHGLAY
jgi:hypothetical protein